MKHNRFILAMALLLPFAAMAQTAEEDSGRTALPEAVKTLVFNDCKALIVPDSRSSYETGKMPNGAEVNVSGSVMTFSRLDRTVHIHLNPGTVTRIEAMGNSEVTLQGSFHFPGTLELVGDNAATINARNTFDTLYADRMVVSLADVSRLNAYSRLQVRTFDFSVKDYSRLKAFVLEQTGDSDGTQSSFTNTQYASFHIGHRLQSGERVFIDPEEVEDFWNTNDDAFDIDDLADLDADALSDLVRKIKLRSTKHYSWGANLDFAWGFHNWGTDRLNGLAGMDGDAAVRTSFNHILLTLNYPVVYSKHVALYAGLGLEWDKYKFHRGDIHFDLTAEPYHLTNGTVANSESRLLTRYVILPIEVTPLETGPRRHPRPALERQPHRPAPRHHQRRRRSEHQGLQHQPLHTPLQARRPHLPAVPLPGPLLPGLDAPGLQGQLRRTVPRQIWYHSLKPMPYEKDLVISHNFDFQFSNFPSPADLHAAGTRRGERDTPQRILAPHGEAHQRPHDAADLQAVPGGYREERPPDHPRLQHRPHPPAARRTLHRLRGRGLFQPDLRGQFRQAPEADGTHKRLCQCTFQRLAGRLRLGGQHLAPGRGLLADPL